MIRRGDTKGIDRAQVRAQLAMMLASARSLEHFTVDFLMRSYRLPEKEITYALTIARQKRAAQ